MGLYKYDSIRNKFEEAHSSICSVLPQVVWHITDTCFLACPYCFSTKSSLETPAEKVSDYVNMFIKLGVQKIDIAGGEPLTYDHLEIVCNELSRANIPFTISTSGFGKPSVTEWLTTNCHLCSWIIISLDGGTPREHDLLRGKDGVFSSLNTLVSRIKALGYEKIRINTVITKHLLDEHNRINIISLVKEIRPLEWCLIEPHPANEKPSFNRHVVSTTQFTAVVERLKQLTVSSMSDVKISQRFADNYSRYWILYPNGTLRQHTHESEDRFSFQFQNDSLKQIKKAVADYGYWLPMTKEGNK